MTQYEIDILLKDLCMRLPYGVNMATPYGKGLLTSIRINDSVEKLGININPLLIRTFSVDDVKPYLFPLSSMTEEQYYELQNCSSDDCLEHMEVVKTLRDCTDFTHWPLYEHRVIDWFNKNHFDYRDLISMGLANDATGLNIY